MKCDQWLKATIWLLFQVVTYMELMALSLISWSLMRFVKSLQNNESLKLTEKQPGKGPGTQNPKWSMWHKGNLYEVFISINNCLEEPAL